MVIKTCSEILKLRRREMGPEYPFGKVKGWRLVTQ